MSFRRLVAIELKLIAADGQALVLTLLLPLVLLPFLQPTGRAILRSAGFSSANGFEQAGPGSLTFFAFFLAQLLLFSVYRDHGWGVWDRVRVLSRRPSDLLVARATAFGLTGLVLTGVVLGVSIVLIGSSVFDAAEATLVLVALVVCVVAFGALLTTLTTTLQQASAASNLATALFGVIGGTIVTVEALPRWARHASPASPSYWAMRGFRSIFVSGSADDVVVSCGVLLAFALGFGILAAKRFHASDSRIGWV